MLTGRAAIWIGGCCVLLACASSPPPFDLAGSDWRLVELASPEQGEIVIGPELASTRAMCPPSPLTERFAQDLPRMTSTASRTAA